MLSLILSVLNFADLCLVHSSQPIFKSLKIDSGVAAQKIYLWKLLLVIKRTFRHFQQLSELLLIKKKTFNKGLKVSLVRPLRKSSFAITSKTYHRIINIIIITIIITITDFNILTTVNCQHRYCLHTFNE